ncbi:MAG: response regulator [Bacteroidales bacterium]|nr:response regulator [Bacteroidales bacterium]
MDFIISLIQNTAILLSFSMLYEYYWIKLETKSLKSKIITGMMLSLAVSIIMFTPFKLTETIVFDVRSVLLSIAGLFFGIIPTLMAVITSLLIRIHMGGDGVYMGIAVILSSSGIGLVWRYYRPNWKENNYVLNLFLLGTIVHLTMALCTVFLPSGKEMAVLKNIAIPLVAVYIPGTMLLGILMVRQYKNYQNRKAKEQLIELEYKFYQLMKSNNIYTLIANSNNDITFVNEHLIFSLKKTENDVLNKNFKNLFLQKMDEENTHKTNVFYSSALVSSKIDAGFSFDQFNFTYVNWFITKTFDYNNQHSGYIIIGVDYTEKRNTETKLKEAHQELLAQYEIYKELNEQLTLANQKAEENSRLKSMLLSNLSHEVRTPMNAILGFSELMRKDLPEDKRREFSNLVYKSARQLLQTIDDIVLISKLQSQKTKLHKSKVKPLNLLKTLSILNQHKDNYQHIELKIVYDKLHEHLQIETDENKLIKVLENLLSNAYLYTPQGKIEIGFYTEENYIIFFVKDSGLGISEEDKPYIFESFYRGQSAKSFAIRGIGLGLSIVSELVKLLNGNIWFESQPEQGSTFFVKIPTTIISTNDQNDETTPAKTFSPESLKNVSILIAEDEYLNFQFLEAMLHPIVKQVDYAQNGSIAVDKCKSHTYDFVLMDIRMPYMNGIEATKEIKKIQPSLPIIALTSYNDEVTQHEAFKAGCDKFISKPVYLDDLINTFQTLM